MYLGDDRHITSFVPAANGRPKACQASSDDHNIVLDDLSTHGSLSYAD
jgi:hypothetical protein